MEGPIIQITITAPGWLLLLLLTLALAVLLLLVFSAKPLLRYGVKRLVNDVVATLLKDEYTQNLAELLPSVKRFSLLNIIDLSLRAESGKVIARPLGSPKHGLTYENLMFSPLQMTGVSLPDSATVDMSVTLGPTAKKTLTISTPLLIGGMGFGLALSEEAKVALARAAKILQTATCSGEGPYLPEEREAAGKFILQISRWPWGRRTDEQIAAADMLEVQIGHGADLGAASVEPKQFSGKARILAGLSPGQPAISSPSMPGIERPEDWPGFMDRLRQQANGIPIALKLMATDRLEADLSVAVDLGFDAVVVCGYESGTHAVPAAKMDDLGLPTLYGLIRAKRFLRNSPVSLIIAGGHFTPGQCLKALALGADAIFLGTVPLFALVHNQLHKVIPWEPPTTLVFYESPGKSRLSVDQAAQSVVNALTSMNLEMQEVMRCLGKTTLKELTADDLVALDSVTAEVAGVKRAY